MEQEHVQDRGAASDHLNRGILANSVVGPKHQTPELQVHTYPKMLHESSGKVVLQQCLFFFVKLFDVNYILRK